MEVYENPAAILAYLLGFDAFRELLLFVASDEASFSTGSEFIADGGMLLGPVPQLR
jgi:hypothetical protein